MYTQIYSHSDSRRFLLCRYRGALWGMMVGGPQGIATSLNMAFDDPAMALTSIVALWLSGGFCGHSMQALLDGTR